MRTIRTIHRLLEAFLGSAALLLLPLPAGAADYSVGGTVKVYASPSGPETVRSTNRTNQETQASDSLLAYGATGVDNFATARFRVDLSTGSIGAFSQAVNAFDPDYPQVGGNSWLGGTAGSDAFLSDALFFTIPAGTYASGLVATLNGRMTGQIFVPAVSPPYAFSNLGFSSWGVEFQRNLAGPNTLASINEQSGFIFATGVTQKYVVDRPFSLQINILDAGTTLLSPLVVDTRVAAYIGRTAANSATVNSNEAASVTADFYNCLKLQSVVAPVEVTWSSASGVFLVPEPASFLMLLAGLPLLVLLARRRRAR